MDSSEHIKNFTIKNFKKFESIEMKNIGQFNMIFGDNNIGKSSILEALLFEENLENYLYSLFTVLSHRQVIASNFISKSRSIINYLKFFLNKFLDSNEIHINCELYSGEKSEIVLRIEQKLDKKSKEYDFLVEQEGEFFEERIRKRGRGRPIQEGFISLTINGKLSQVILTDNFSFDPDDIPGSDDDLPYPAFIPFSQGYQISAGILFSKYIKTSKNVKAEFIKNLKGFIPEIENIELTANYDDPKDRYPLLEIIENGSDKPFPLSMMGDGANKIFRVLIEIAACENRKLMIDEIDTGIHYSRFRDFWRAVLHFARKYNVQIFATTHNIECIKYFKEVLEELEMSGFQDNSRTFSIRNIKNSPTIYTFTFPEFQSCIETDVELR